MTKKKAEKGVDARVLPPGVYIGATYYHIVQDRAAIEADEVEAGVEVDGYIRHREQVINLHPDLEFDVLRETLVHEMLHGVTNAAGIYSSDEMDEEQFVRRISSILLEVLRRNSRLVEWLVA